MIVFFVLTLSPMSICAQKKDTLNLKSVERKAKANFLLQNRPWTIEIPIWVPGFAGDFAYGDIELEGEDGGDPGDPEDPDDDIDRDILSRLFTKDWYLKFFYLGRFGYEKNRFLAQLDAISGGVGNSVKFNYNNKEIVESSIVTLNLRIFAAYQFFKTESKSKKFRYELFGYLGVRFHFQKLYSNLNRTENHLDVRETWVEPIIGVQNQFTLKRWFFIVAGDYGGFFVHTKYSSQISAICYYRMGGLTSIKVGWNHLVLNHEGRNLNNDLKIKLTLSGPSVGLAFHF